MIWFILLGLLFIALAIPLIRRKVPPNSWYGFRHKRTLDDTDVWYAANTYSGKWLLVLGVLIIATAMLLPAIFNDLSQDAYAIVMLILMLVGVLLVLLRSLRYVETL